jgi:hypothetical protein
VTLLPIVLRLVNDKAAGVVCSVTNENWQRMIRETRMTTKEFRDAYGVRISGVRRKGQEFLALSVRVVEENKYRNWDESGTAVGDTVAKFLNHTLSSGGYPSFYKDNEGPRGAMIWDFISV